MSMRRILSVVVLALAVVTGGGLLIAAIGKVREAAARIGCRNNLRQLGIALDNYQAQLTCYPRAALPNAALPPEGRLSWLVALVPYVECDDLYSKLDKEKGWEADENRFAALAPYRTYLCPSLSDTTPVSTPVPSSYVGCAGVGPDAASLPSEDAQAGFFGYDRKLTFADVQRRTSTLLVALETARTEGTWTAAGRPTVRGLDPDGPPYVGNGGQFGGLHSGGANAVFADASVRFVPRNTDPEVLKAMATLQGGKDLVPVGEEY
jgi:prepilin-type processing-associated H-X9-DG protein